MSSSSVSRAHAAWWSDSRHVLRMPLYAAELLTAAKSFEENPLLSDPRLNDAGLHVARVRAAHWLAWRRRASLTHLISAEDRQAFDRDGFVVRRSFLPPKQFAEFVSEVKRHATHAREKLEGDTLLRKIALDEDSLAALPTLRLIRDNPAWRGLFAYADAQEREPALYLQTLFRNVGNGPADHQTHLHADTFHPSAKAWLFLTDVAEDEGPFCYVPGSHLLTPERLAFEARMSRTAAASDIREVREGSFRVQPEDLRAMGLSEARKFAVPANTLVVADTFGLHARGPSSQRSQRVELWAFGRRNPLLPYPLDRAIQRLRKAPQGAETWTLRAGVSAFDPPAE